MSDVHFSGPVRSANGFIDGSGSNVVTGADLASITSTAAEIDVLAGVTPGTAAASKAVVLNSSKGITTITSATITTMTGNVVGNVTGNVTGNTAGAVAVGATDTISLGVASKTAGTTQTQAGATAITSPVTLGTTGNADDGYLLPAMTAGKLYIIHNLSTNAGKVYANGTETLNGTAGNAGSTALTASKTMFVIGTGAGTSVSFVCM